MYFFVCNLKLYMLYQRHEIVISVSYWVKFRDKEPSPLINVKVSQGIFGPTEADIKAFLSSTIQH